MFRRQAFLIISSIVIILTVQSHADCTPEVIREFRTTVARNLSGSTAEQLKQYYCSHADAGGSVLWGLGNGSSTKDVCKSKDLTFFETHTEELAFSFLPPEAQATLQKICSPSGTSLRLNVSSAGRDIGVDAYFTPVNNDKDTRAVVKSFFYSRNMMDCKVAASQLHKGAIIASGGNGGSCTRLSGEAGSVTLITDKGIAVAHLAEYPKPTIQLHAYQVDDVLRCEVNGGAGFSANSDAGGHLGQALWTIPPDQLKVGENVIRCTITDVYGCDHKSPQECPSWGYVLDEIVENRTISLIDTKDNHVPVVQPNPIYIKYATPFDPPSLQFGSMRTGFYVKNPH